MKKIIITAGVLFAVFVFAYVYGAASYKLNLFPMEELRALKREVVLLLYGVSLGYNDASDRKRVDCRQFAKNTVVIFTFGQSNAANSGGSYFTPASGVYNLNFLDGRCYEAKGPLLGTTQAGGSVWTRLGDMLVRKGGYDSVLFVPIAVSNSKIIRWAPGGAFHNRITRALDMVKEKGLNITYMFWHQGESDAFVTTRQEYIDHFTQIVEAIRSRGFNTPIYVSVATVCASEPSAAISQAQKDIPIRLNNVYQGADTDTIIDPLDRYDRCHFTNTGLKKHAALWFSIITNAQH